MLVICFFQAEDGIRDVAVTGVQTCALPISPEHPRRSFALPQLRSQRDPFHLSPFVAFPSSLTLCLFKFRFATSVLSNQEIASASCSSRSEEHTSELQSRLHLVCRLLLEKKKLSSRRNLVGSVIGLPLWSVSWNVSRMDSEGTWWIRPQGSVSSVCAWV